MRPLRAWAALTVVFVSLAVASASNASAVGARRSARITDALTLTVRPDPGAPAGVAPKLSFVLSGVRAGRSYGLSWLLQGRRASTSCTALGQVLSATAEGPTVTLGPAPSGEYGDPTFRPFCVGRTYTATIRTGPSTVIATLMFRAPAAGGATVSGTVRSVTGATVSGGYVWLCPLHGTSLDQCQFQLTDASADYAFAGIAPGPYTLQADPPGGAGSSSFAAAAPLTLNLTAGQSVRQDMTLTPARTISSGVVVDTVDGAETRGVASVSDFPAKIDVPIDASASAAPDSADLVGAVLNVSAPNGLNIADAAMFEVHYGHNGRADKISQLIEGPGQATTEGGSSPMGCQGTRPAFAFEPTAAGGVRFTFDDGSGLPLMLHFDPFAFPAPSADNTLSLAADGLIGVANASLDTVPGLGEYNAAVYGLNVAANGVHGNYAAALSGAFFSFGLPALAERSGIPDTPYAGPAQFSAFEFSAAVTEGSVDQVLPDPPSPHGCMTRTGGGELYVDPSGRVLTPQGAAVTGARVTISRGATPTGPFAPIATGSALLSPSTRRNPERTDALGSFGWDVIPGFYRVSASHRGCRAAGRGAAARTGTLRIPPPISGLLLRLRCPRLRLSLSRTTLRVSRPRLATASGIGHVVTLTATVRSGRRSASGIVTFRAARRTIGSLVLDRRGRAVLTVPRVPTGRLIASYSGNGAIAASSGHADGSTR